MRISIFGLGYVGCVSLGCLAQNGHDIIGIDVNPVKVDLINRGKPTIIEKDIDQIVKEQKALGKIRATCDHSSAVRESDVSIICVGTPSTERGDLNLEYIYQTAEQIGEALRHKQGFHIAVIRSTVLPGTNWKVGEILAKSSGLKRNEGFAVVSNPEFLREGTAVEDYYNPPFTLFGTDNDHAATIMRNIYSKVNGEIIRSDIRVAELIKYVNNSFHALKVTFANEVGNVCKKLGVDSHELMNVFCMDRQLNISPYYFKPGFAYGGSCLPKDLKALKTLAATHGLSSPVLEAIEPSNQNHIRMVVERIIGKTKGKVGVLGIAFKEGTDDLRYSPVIKVIESLFLAGIEVKAHDSFVKQALLMGANKEYVEGGLPFLPALMSDSEDHIVNWADCVVFNRRSPSYKSLPDKYPEKQFIDFVRNGDGPGQSNYDGLCW